MRRAAAQMRSDWEADEDGPFAMAPFFNAVADWLDDAAETADLIVPGGGLGPSHWTMHGHIGLQKARTVARAYLGESE